MSPNAAHIEALLFAEGGSLTTRKLETMLGLTSADLLTALQDLEASLKGHGLSLVRTETEVTLAVSSVSQARVVELLAQEQEKDIGEAGLEVLAILLYEGPLSRATIDFIRGVNSSYTLRALLTRGLVERTGNPADGREFIYRATTETLAHLGVTDRENLPEYATIAAELSTFKANQANNGPGTNTGKPPSALGA